MNHISGTDIAGTDARETDSGQHHDRGAEITRQVLPAIVVAGFFIYMCLANKDLPRSAGQFPAAMAIVGIVLCLLYLAVVLFSGLARLRGEGGGLEGLPPPLTRAEFMRTLRTYVWLGLLVLAIWTFNFHLGIPLFLCTYLFLYAGVRKWWVFVIVTVISVTAVTLIYGEIVRATWSISVIENLLDFNMQRELRRLYPF